MRQLYKHQAIVAPDWPPRIGKTFFGRLALVEKKLYSSTQAESAWHMLRGQVDKTVKLNENKEISIEDVLQSKDYSLSLRVVIDGPPGIGKTTLCRKLLNMWSNGALLYQQYDLVLYCPLRNSKIATATTLADLFEYRRYEVPMVAEWFEKRNGKRLLIIFDGWDELSEQLRQYSLAASIIHRKDLNQCSVIVTSRSYASSSLLKIDTLSRHVQVIGFSKKDISAVIIRTLQKDPKLAQELIDKKINKYSTISIITIQNECNEDSKLAVKLINDLKVREDVQSLCYIPLVCSMVILVYCKEGGHLPTTLTQLYENFILQTIRRHVKRHDINPHTLGSLSSLPTQLAKLFQEMCQIAYTSLANTRMTFSLHQLHSMSGEAVKEDYLGLMTTFIDYDEEKYQFLHLSIQEFLAAWWIAKHEKKTEEVFKNHFNDDHFLLCLRFVAGLTHLEHENYQQYFKEHQLNLQCSTEQPVLFGFETYYFSRFHQYQNKFSAFHDPQSDDFNINVSILLFLVRLLYESQNTALCQVLAQSINNQSLCLVLHGKSFSLFDWLCLNYFMTNSNSLWNSLHLGDISNEKLSVFTADLTNNSLQTQRNGVNYSIQEFYCNISFELMPQVLKLPQLNTLRYVINTPIEMNFVNSILMSKFKSTLGTTSKGRVHSSTCNEIEKSISMNSTVQKLFFMTQLVGDCDSHILSSIIKGVSRNKAITLLSLKIDKHSLLPDPLPNGVIEQLLKENNTLKALVLDFSHEFLPSSLNIVEINTPLTALEIGEKSSKLMILLLPHIKGLHCLVLHEPYPPHLLFLSHPNLHTLTLPLHTAESAIELFIILQINTTLKVLSVEIKEERVYTSIMGASLQDMLKQNQTLKCFEINNDLDRYIPSSFLSFLTTGLRCNTCLQQLSVPIPLNKEITAFIKIVSQSKNLTELKMDFRLDCYYSLYRNCSEREKEQIMTPLFYEQLLPAVTNMLLLHTTMKILRIKCEDINGLSQPKWKELVQLLYRNIYIHPSLEYIEITTGYTTSILEDTFHDQEMILTEMHKKKQPQKSLPIVKFIATGIIALFSY